MKRNRSTIAGTLATFALLIWAPAAGAADSFVDDAIGSDSNSCLSAAQACATIPAAVAKAGTGDTVRVAPGIYEGQIELTDGKSLRATGTPASTVIDSATLPTIDVTGAAGSIEGFTIRGEGGSSNATPVVPVLRLGATATVRGNVFDADDDNPNFPVDLFLDSGAGSATVSQNTFSDDGVDGSGDTTAILTSSAGSPTISDNRLDGFFTGIEALAGTSTISGNLITGTHNRSDSSQGTGIEVTGQGAVNSAATIVGNLVRAPRARPTIGMPDGIAVIQFVTGPSAPTVGATLQRNRVAGAAFGIDIFNTRAPVSLEGDVVTDSTIIGLKTGSTALMPITATNITLASNAFDVTASSTALTLNSSIVEDGISATNGTTCAISFSRGPTTSGNACQTFQTSLDPLFVTTAPGADKNVHLQATSTLRSEGDPADPAVPFDIDGDARALPPNGTSSTRREIGADEVIPPDFDQPDTQVTSGPLDGSTSNANVSFDFTSSTTPTATFQCSLDGTAFSACTSAKDYPGLGAGQHTFAVRAVEPVGGGIPDGTPATRTFTVDASPPETTIDAGPAAGSTTSGSPSFEFGSEAGASFECSLDGGAFAACDSPDQLSGLATGSHTLVARALDAVGNADTSPVSRTWTVDADPPQTRFTSGPANGAAGSDPSPRYGFGSEAGARFECRVDGGAFEPCSSPDGPNGLSDGRHRFAVRAIDAVGNTDPTPAERSLVVDTTAPNTRVGKPKVKGRRAKARLKADEPGARFECKLDRGTFKRCKAKLKLKRLKPGRHVLLVRAVDALGNADATPAKRKFKVKRKR